MNRMISQGEAMRSVLGRARVTHSMSASWRVRSPGGRPSFPGIPLVPRQYHGLACANGCERKGTRLGGAPDQGQRGGPGPRDQPGYVAPVGPRRPHPGRPRPFEPSDGSRGRGGTPVRAGCPGSNRDEPLRSQPLGRRRPGGPGRQRDGPGRDPGGPVRAGRRDHQGRGGGARPGPGCERGRHHQGHVGHGGPGDRPGSMTRPNRPIRHLIVAAEACTVLLAGACYRSPGDTPAPPQVTLTVLAASSVGTVFSQIAGAFNRNHPSVAFQFSVGGTDQLVAQIEQGAPSDVFAGASTKYGDQLRSEGLIQPPEPFCTNRLVLVLPAANPAGITGLEDLTRPGLRLVIGAESVPVGAYT